MARGQGHEGKMPAWTAGETLRLATLARGRQSALQGTRGALRLKIIQVIASWSQLSESDFRRLTPEMAEATYHPMKAGRWDS